jgi:hypothetical protein
MIRFMTPFCSGSVFPFAGCRAARPDPGWPCVSSILLTAPILLRDNAALARMPIWRFR